MHGATSALYAPLIERDLDGVAAAAGVFLQTQSEDELWVAVTRFAVLAYAPSQHSKRAVMACRAVHEMREELGREWRAMVVECARYSAETRAPWSEPPILDPPPVDSALRPAIDELRAAVAEGDRLQAERWLSSRLDDCEGDLRAVATGDATLMLDTAVALESLLGEKGRFALFRMVVHELFAPGDDPAEPLEALVERAIAENGAVDAVRSVLIAIARMPAPATAPLRLDAGLLKPYALARDYAQTLIAHAVAHRLPSRAEELLRAVHHNLEHGESFADWSFA